MRAANIVPGLILAGPGALAIVPFATLHFEITSSALLAPTYVRGE
ncbi:MAG: hypothetical protein AVDCRST_MAG37-1555 [uncultured Rubrobacteraceae bacterium]|uniref:Uncharacterized protein n=1 Tax=uncultured Rubrobacteraceae bacterium TaxID=349277 RepID=A0A6J4QG10_9ACTN|nr:MAG: hypothetical protein AVDCRST_MAG37-1555 [uncultured Rubrobacteraceae bacterium]